MILWTGILLLIVGSVSFFRAIKIINSHLEFNSEIKSSPSIFLFYRKASFYFLSSGILLVAFAYLGVELSTGQVGTILVISGIALGYAIGRYHAEYLSWKAIEGKWDVLDKLDK